MRIGRGRASRPRRAGGEERRARCGGTAVREGRIDGEAAQRCAWVVGSGRRAAERCAGQSGIGVGRGSWGHGRAEGGCDATLEGGGVL